MHFGRFLNKDGAACGVNAEMPLEKVIESCNANVGAPEINLDRQLQAWRNNPSWTDEPAEIKVSNCNCHGWSVSLPEENSIRARFYTAFHLLD